jgi:hypothetical protein
MTVASTPTRSRFSRKNAAREKRAASKIINDLAVYHGRHLLGHILETDDGSHQAVTADGEVIGSYRSRQEASRVIPAPTR